MKQSLTADHAAVFDSMADGVIVTDADGEIVILSGPARAMLGLPSQPDGQQRPINAAYLKSRLGFYPFELVQRPAAAPPGTVLIRETIQVGGRVLHSVVTTAQEPGGLVMVLRDTNPEAERVPEGASATHPLKAPRGELPATLFHELRTPLTSVTGSLDLALGGHLGPLSRRQALYLELAREACARLGGIVDELVDAVKPGGAQESPPVLLQPALLDLGALVNETVTRFGPAAQDKRVTLRTRAPQAIPPLQGDRARLAQVLSNLLANALRFAPAETGEVLVELVASERFPEVVALAVSNNGQPVAPAQVEQLFDRHVGGTGLGLPVSRAILEAHGGTIWLEQPAELGARFVLTVPVSGRGLAVAASNDTSLTAAAMTTELHRRLTTLVVSPSRHDGYLLRGLVALLGHHVQLASDAEEALLLAQQHRPALIFLNESAPLLDEPGRTGERGGGLDTLLAILKHDPETRQIPVAQLTCPPSASCGAEDIVPLRTAGLGRIITASQPDVQWTTPLLATHLVGAMESLVREHRGDRQAKILVVDDDATVRMICRELLEARGYLVRDAVDGSEALSEARRFRPDLLILDVMMPGADGFETAAALRAESATAITPLIFLSARGQTADKVRAFKFGADDYMVKPFDAVELLARVEKALERAERELEASPTTRLPGSAAIETEVNRRLGAAQPLVLCYLDLDNLKAFNDHYGYAKADGVVRQTADLLREVIGSHGTRSEFIGHIAGDDFVLVTTPERADRLAEHIIEGFDRVAPLYYNKVDRQRGYIETHDRFGVLRRFPVISVSLAALTALPGRFRSHDELAAAATELKRLAKSVAGSSYVRDGVLRIPRPVTSSAGPTEASL